MSVTQKEGQLFKVSIHRCGENPFNGVLQTEEEGIEVDWVNFVSYVILAKPHFYGLSRTRFPAEAGLLPRVSMGC